jgi:broad specificity phosphatase PhoE
VILSALLVLARSSSSCALTFVRHGETVANSTSVYNERTLNSFSDKGQKEVFDLTQRLVSGPSFDRILVSPAPRVLKTIAPYLRAKGLRATIWPLLYECCTGHRPKGAHATQFTYGEPIKIPSDLANLFILEPSHDRYPVAPQYNQGLAQVDASVSEFRKLYSKGRVLLVGHSGQGGHFIHELTGKWIKLDNAREISLRVP